MFQTILACHLNYAQVYNISTNMDTSPDFHDGMKNVFSCTYNTLMPGYIKYFKPNSFN